jgi:hypothetical protein
MFALGLDWHGVVDKYPKLFSLLSNLVFGTGNKVYIVTGHKNTPELRAGLERLGIKYNEILSVIDYHEKIGSRVWYDEKNTPWIDGELWNRAKAELCEKYDIDMLIDDSEIYGRYFTGKTKYLLLK